MPDLSTRGRSSGDFLVPVLLAAFVIVVGAFLATVVLDMGQSPQGEDVAGTSVEFDAEADAIRVAFTSMSRSGTTLEVSVTNVSDDGVVATVHLSAVGERHAFRGLDDGRTYRVAVVAEWDGQASLVTTRTGSV